MKYISIMILFMGFSATAQAEDDATTEVQAPCCEKNLQSTVGQEESDRGSLIKVSSLVSPADQDMNTKGRGKAIREE